MSVNPAMMRRENNLLDKRARIDATTPILGRKGKIGLLGVGNVNTAVAARTAVSAYAGVAAIEKWGGFRVIGPDAPVVVLNHQPAIAPCDGIPAEILYTHTRSATFVRTTR
jgi:hypothetical protein